jgi:phosphoglycerate dehydrogenase-like enzyme
MKIVIAGRSDEKDIAALRGENPGVEFVTAPHHGQGLLDALEDADALYIHTVTPEMLRAAKKLRWVQSQGAGVEWIWNVPELAERDDITLCNTRGAHAQTIAEHAFGLLLSMTRCLPELLSAQKEHAWKKPSRPVGLSGMTLGVIGLGRIGSAVAQRGHGFDMRVIGVDTNDVPRASYFERFWRLDQLSALLAEADVVVVATPLTPETRGMIGATQLAQMKAGAFLLVVSRGGIVDENALVASLKEGHLAGAGLDVTAIEPLPSDSPLWDAPNLYVTPHCSGASRQTTEGAWKIFAENAERFVRGEALENVVDKRRGY